MQAEVRTARAGRRPAQTLLSSRRTRSSSSTTSSSRSVRALRFSCALVAARLPGCWTYEYATALCVRALPTRRPRLARHHLLSQQLEHRRRQRLGEDVRLLLRGGHPAQTDRAPFHRLRDEMVLHVHMLGALAFDAVL